MIDGERVEFGTSGFLYRSNKLMFDRKTETLWHQFRGVPAVGALLMGWLAERYGLQLTLGAGAVICLMAWAWATRRTRTMAPALERNPPPAP